MRKILIIGLFLSFLGSIILIQSDVLSDNDIKQMSGTYFGYNKFLKEGLENNRDRASFGFILLAAGFGLQIIATIKSKN